MIEKDRRRLTSALQGLVARIAVDLRAQMRDSVREKAQRLHADEKVGEDFDVWTDLLSRRAAVLWVLKSVYVRVLEDRGLLRPGRLLDGEAQELFEKLAPNLGETAFLRWIYDDLGREKGGLPELFARQPAELATPSDALSRELITFWRRRDPDTGAYWHFEEERFEGELMGDLYQELDPVVKDRFALCQTPDFVRAFILDRTLTPALGDWGDAVRLLDPACGSGHFLIDGLKRLVAHRRQARVAAGKTPTVPGSPEAIAEVQDALARVVGIDLNDYACALARTRLVMTAAELAGVTTLPGAGRFHPQVFWADGLEQVEREEAPRALQGDLFRETTDQPRAVLTRSDVRQALRPILSKRFHAVVANPPYIVERDEARKEYHREMIGRDRRYVSATGKYSLGSPFTERCFQLAERDGYVGIITSNNFMKREFGKALIERVIAGLDLTLVVDTSQAYIPFHGTPTVLLFGRQRGPKSETVRAVMGKRGESGTPVDPAKGAVWSSIVQGWDTDGFENEYVSVSNVPLETLKQHPWSLGGGGSAELKERLSSVAERTIGSVATSVGYTTICGEDPVYLGTQQEFRRRGIAETGVPLVVGDAVRDWAVQADTYVLFPYKSATGAAVSEEHAVVSAHFWRFRTLLRSRRIFHQTLEEKGMSWFEHMYRDVPKLRTPLSIAFAFVATHNHFVLDRGGKVFKQSAPVIKLPEGATEDDHYALLGLLNSSTACFWMKQVFYPKGGDKTGDGGRRAVEQWHDRFEFDSTKMKLFPVPTDSKAVIEFASMLDKLANSRKSARAVVDEEEWQAAVGLRTVLADRRKSDLDAHYLMVALQEELDWLCYRLYGLDSGDEEPPTRAIDVKPTSLPWTIALARETDEITDWFTRHGWTPEVDFPADLPAAVRRRYEARAERTRNTHALRLIETANFKRRWYRPDYEAEEQEALDTWLADRVEAAAKERTRPFTVEHLVAAIQDDPRVLAVAEVRTGRQDFSWSQLVLDVLESESVPSQRLHVYKPAGLVKREAWERTWEDQRREDAGEAVTPEVPPSYGSGDFLRTEHWQLRGKLDVPKERFMAFTEVPGRAGAETLYGWAGWTPVQRLRALLGIDESLEDAGVPVADRIGILDSAWRLLPDVAREDAVAAAKLKPELQAVAGASGPSPEAVAAWQARFPPPRARPARKAAIKAKAPSLE